MKIKKAVITAAGKGRHLYPVATPVQKSMIPITDRDGVSKPLIQIVVEEAFYAGIEELCIVCSEGESEVYKSDFETLKRNVENNFLDRSWAKSQLDDLGKLLNSIQYVEQCESKGYGHAVLQAKEFCAGEPFLLMLGDYLYLSDLENENCASQLIKLAEKTKSSVFAVKSTMEHLIHNYGTLTGNRVDFDPGTYEVTDIIEKPTISEAELNLQTNGLRAGYYLCLFGMNVLTPKIFEYLSNENEKEDYFRLTKSLVELSKNQNCYALEIQGKRYDTSKAYGLLEAELAFGLSGKERSKLLSKLVKLISEEGLN